MFLKLLSSGNLMKNRFSSFINSFPGHCKMLAFTRSTFCTAAFGNSQSTPYKYYYSYLMSKPESYTCFHDALLLQSEVEKSNEPFKALTDLFNNLENMSSDELLKNIVTEFNASDINEIWKKIVFIDKMIVEKPKSVNLLKLLNYLDEELRKKILSYDERLMALIVSHKFQYLKINGFLRKNVMKLLTKIKYLSPEQVVQFFFGMPKLDLSKFEDKYFVCSYLNNNISMFNADELAIIMYGMHKGSLTFNNKSINNTIFSKITENIKNMHSITVQSLCKALSSKGWCLNSSCTLDFQEKVLPYVSNLDKPILLGLLELEINNTYINSILFETMARKYKENINDLSPSLITRVVKQMISHNIKNEEYLLLFCKVFDEYENYSEIYKELIFFLSNLTYYQLYPKNLLDIVLSEQFVLEKILTSKCFIRVKFYWWVLYCNLEMEKPELLNYSLNIKERQKINRAISGWMNDTNVAYINERTSTSFKHIEIMLKKLYGESAVVYTACLPQYECGLVLRFDKYLKALPIPDDFNLSNKSFAKKPLDDDNYWIFLNVLNRNQYLNDDTLLIHRQTQIRLLKALKYIPVMVPNELYKKHLKENTQDIFITELIQKSLETEDLKIKEI